MRRKKLDLKPVKKFLKDNFKEVFYIDFFNFDEWSQVTKEFGFILLGGLFGAIISNSLNTDKNSFQFWLILIVILFSISTVSITIKNGINFIKDILK